MTPKHIVPFAALALLTACGSKEKTDTGASASATASSEPAHHKMGGAASAMPSGTAAAMPTGSAQVLPTTTAGPKWLTGIPVKPATAKAGDRVWTLTPDAAPEHVLFGVVEVDSLQPDGLTTVGLTRTGDKWVKDAGAAAKHMHMPGALASAAQTVDVAKIKNGDIVIAPVFGYHTTAAHVIKVAGTTATVKYVDGDKVHEETTDYAMPLAKGIAPFAYVAVKSGAGYKEILVAAVVDDQVYGVDEAGTFYKAAKADVKPLNVVWKDRKKGDKVVVFDASGNSDSVIDTVSVEKWVYKVKAGGAEKRVPFYAVVDSL